MSQPPLDSTPIVTNTTNVTTSNDAKVDLASSPNTGNHTSGGKVKVVDTSNESFQQKLLSN